MNEATMIDTHQAFENLQGADFTKKQAEVVVGLVNEVAASRHAELATKGDLENLRVATQRDLAAGLAEIKLTSKRDMAELETRLTWRIVTLVAIAVAVIGLLLKLV